MQYYLLCSKISLTFGDPDSLMRDVCCYPYFTDEEIKKLAKGSMASREAGLEILQNGSRHKKHSTLHPNAFVPSCTRKGMLFSYCFPPLLRLLTLRQTPLYPYCSVYFSLPLKMDISWCPPSMEARMVLTSWRLNWTVRTDQFSPLYCLPTICCTITICTICWLEYFFYLPTFHYSITATLHCDSHSSF